MFEVNRKIKTLIQQIKKTRSRKKLNELLDQLLLKIEDETEVLRLQLLAREKELEECKKELNEIHKSISYRVGRWIAETKIGKSLKQLLWKIFKIE